MYHIFCSSNKAVAQAQRDAANIPEGMRLLPEDERLQTLSILAQSKADTEAKLRVRFSCALTSQRLAQSCLSIDLYL